MKDYQGTLLESIELLNRSGDNPQSDARIILYLLGGMTGIETKWACTIEEARSMMTFLEDQNKLYSEGYPDDQNKTTITNTLAALDTEIKHKSQATTQNFEAAQKAYEALPKEDQKDTPPPKIEPLFLGINLRELEKIVLSLSGLLRLQQKSYESVAQSVKESPLEATGASLEEMPAHYESVAQSESVKESPPEATGASLEEMQAHTDYLQLEPLYPAIRAFMIHDHGKSAILIRSLIEAVKDGIPGEESGTYSEGDKAALKDISAWASINNLLGTDSIDSIQASKEGLESIIDHDELMALAIRVGSQLPVSHFLHDCHLISNEFKGAKEVDWPRLLQGQGDILEVFSALSDAKALSELESKASAGDSQEKLSWVNLITQCRPGLKEWANGLSLIQLRTYGFVIKDLLGQSSMGLVPFFNKAQHKHSFALSLLETTPGSSTLELFPMMDRAVQKFGSLEDKDRTPENAFLCFTQEAIGMIGSIDEDTAGIMNSNKLETHVGTALLLGRMTTTPASKSQAPGFVRHLVHLLFEDATLKAALDRSKVKVGYGPEAFAVFTGIYLFSQTAEGQKFTSDPKAFNTAFSDIAKRDKGLEAAINPNKFMGDEAFVKTLSDPKALKVILTAMKDAISETAPNQNTGLKELNAFSKVNVTSSAYLLDRLHAINQAEKAATVEPAPESGAASASSLAGGGAMSLDEALKDAVPVPASSASDLAEGGAMPPAQEQANTLKDAEQSTDPKRRSGGAS
ncbi:MAG: hypothetical protein CMF51_01480 [Legionellales bacterium]|nr:hypothetical protein [Legionellales bacterium]